MKESFDIGRTIVEGVVNGEAITKVFLTILIIVFGMVAKPAFEWLAERNRPLAIALSLVLLVFAIYMGVSTFNYENRQLNKTNDPAENITQDETPRMETDSTLSKPEITTEPTSSDISVDTTTSNHN